MIACDQVWYSNRTSRNHSLGNKRACWGSRNSFLAISISNLISKVKKAWAGRVMVILPPWTSRISRIYRSALAQFEAYSVNTADNILHKTLLKLTLDLIILFCVCCLDEHRLTIFRNQDFNACHMQLIFFSSVPKCSHTKLIKIEMYSQYALSRVAIIGPSCEAVITLLMNSLMIGVCFWAADNNSQISRYFTERKLYVFKVIPTI